MKTFFFPQVNSKVKSDLGNIITEYTLFEHRHCSAVNILMASVKKKKKKCNSPRVIVSKIITRDKNTGESSRKQTEKALFVY